MAGLSIGLALGWIEWWMWQWTRSMAVQRNRRIPRESTMPRTSTTGASVAVLEHDGKGWDMHIEEGGLRLPDPTRNGND